MIFDSIAWHQKMFSHLFLPKQPLLILILGIFCMLHLWWLSPSCNCLCVNICMCACVYVDIFVFFALCSSWLLQPGDLPWEQPLMPECFVWHFLVKAIVNKSISTRSNSTNSVPSSVNDNLILIYPWYISFCSTWKPLPPSCIFSRLKIWVDCGFSISYNFFCKLYSKYY